MDNLLLDACVAINLLASDVALDDLAGASSVHFVMASVAAAEMLWLAPIDPAGARESVDLRALASAGHLNLVDLFEDELARFIDLARSLDDGEAATFAVAIHRRLPVATDDRRAQRVAREMDPPIRIVGTTQLVRAWIEVTDVRLERAAQVVRTIERRASYIPRRDDPNLSWWFGLRQGPGET